MDTPVLHIVLHVKFRAFGTDLANWSYSHDVPVPVELGWLASNQELVNLNQRGVTLQVFFDPIAPSAPPTPGDPPQ